LGNLIGPLNVGPHGERTHDDSVNEWEVFLEHADYQDYQQQNDQEVVPGQVVGRRSLDAALLVLVAEPEAWNHQRERPTEA
jgi:hypothetical protein